MDEQDWDEVIAATGSALLEDGSVRVIIGPNRPIDHIVIFAGAVAEWCGIDEIDVTTLDASHILLSRYPEPRRAAEWN